MLWPDMAEQSSDTTVPLRLKSPRYVFARHLMKSSSIPPADVTITSTILFCTR